MFYTAALYKLLLWKYALFYTLALYTKIALFIISYMYILHYVYSSEKLLWKFICSTLQHSVENCCKMCYTTTLYATPPPL